jgi:hypothetical protein
MTTYTLRTRAQLDGYKSIVLESPEYPERYILLRNKKLDEDDIKLECGLYLAGTNTLDTLLKFTGVKTFDYAVPQTWADDLYFSKGKPLPRVVWCYDDSLFGYPLYFTEVLAKFNTLLSTLDELNRVLSGR